MNSEFLFLGFVSSKIQIQEIIKKDKNPQYQTYKFTMNLLKALECSNDIDITYFSFQPVSDYPYFNRKYFGYSEEQIDILNKQLKIYNLPFYNTSLLKIITRTLSSIFYGIKIFKNKKNKKGIIVYSVHVPYMLAGILLGWIFKKKVIGIWTDPPSISNHMENKLKNKLRQIELKVSKFLMKKMDKIIVMTKYLAEDFAPQKPYLIIEGIASQEKIIKTNKKQENKKIKIVYTGTLDINYGIKNIIEGFKMVENKNINLEIYGKGNFEEEIKKDILIDSRIKYFGFLDNEEILKVQKNADFLINARPNDQDYTKYSFPSKMIEYMISGTPVMTTILEGFPEEYENYLIILDNNSPIEIFKKINEISKWTSFQKNELGEKAREFILKKSYINQGEKIKKFINE